jgi:hypothetical protein
MNKKEDVNKMSNKNVPTLTQLCTNYKEKSSKRKTSFHFMTDQLPPDLTLDAQVYAHVNPKWDRNRFFSELFSFYITIIPSLFHIHSCIFWEMDSGLISDHSLL